MKSTQYTTVDEYLAMFPKEISDKLQIIRMIIKETAPEAIETISYQMPAFKHKGMLVYFAAFEKHIGFYPGSSGVLHFEHELKAYKTSKGTLQIPHSSEIPIEVIRKIVAFRLRENELNAEMKKTKKKA